MKKRVLLAVVLQFFLVLNCCSSDSGDDSKPITEPPVVVIKEARVTSYSKNVGETGETVSIYGENFSDKVSDIKITFDDVATTIISASATEIKIILPQTEKVLPELNIIIDGKKAINEVTNDYYKNMGILPVPSTTGWFTIENTLKSKPENEIRRIQMLSDKIFYYSLGDYVYKTLDGGVSWKEWGYNYGGNGGFRATMKGDGLCYTLFGLSSNFVGGVIAIPPSGDIRASKNLFKEVGGAYPGIPSVYIDEDMQKGTIVSQKGVVYTNENGGEFVMAFDSQLYINSNALGNIYRGTQIDNNHIWNVGVKTERGVKRPFILFKNNETDGWKQHLLKDELGTYGVEINFPDMENGFVLLSYASTGSVLKTNNGGDTWEKIYFGESFDKFTFKDANTGWAISGNKIYKTVDGGTSWTLDYTNDQPIKNIACKNNVVWAISTDKIIKRYL